MNGRALGAFCALTVLWALLLLVGPRHPDPIFRPMTYRNLDLPGPFGLSLSVDSPEFVRLALEPSRLLEPRSVRQSRPGMVLVAAPLALALARFVDPPSAAGFVAYVIVNIAILAASFALYLAIVRPPSHGVSLPIFTTGLLLLFNNVTTYFLLSPHTALCNLLAPLLCLWIAERTWRDGLFRDRRVFAVALLGGLGFASYGSFAMALPALLLPAAVRERLAGRSLGLAFLARAAGVTAVLLAPIGAWYALVVAASGTFYSAEVEMFRSFVWITDGARSHGWPSVAAKLATLAWLGMRNALLMARPALTLVAIAFLVVPPPRRDLWRRVRTDAALAAFVFVLFLGFFVLSGFVWNRNVYSVTVPLIALAGSCVAQAEPRLPPKRLRAAAWVFALAAAAYAALVLVQDFGRPISLA